MSCQRKKNGRLGQVWMMLTTSDNNGAFLMTSRCLGGNRLALALGQFARWRSHVGEGPEFPVSLCASVLFWMVRMNLAHVYASTEK
jgi:hypothetical protein